MFSRVAGGLADSLRIAAVSAAASAVVGVFLRAHPAERRLRAGLHRGPSALASWPAGPEHHGTRQPGRRPVTRHVRRGRAAPRRSAAQERAPGQRCRGRAHRRGHRTSRNDGWARLPADGLPGEPMTGQTLLDLASVTKVAATTTLIMRLVADGAAEPGRHRRIATCRPSPWRGKDGRHRRAAAHPHRRPATVVAAVLRGPRPRCGARARAARCRWTARRERGVALLRPRPHPRRPRSSSASPPSASPTRSASLVAEPLGLAARYGPVPAGRAAASADSDAYEFDHDRRQAARTRCRSPRATSPAGGTAPLRGVVNDGNAAHALGGVAGHAGLFATVDDLLTPRHRRARRRPRPRVRSLTVFAAPTGARPRPGGRLPPRAPSRRRVRPHACCTTAASPIGLVPQDPMTNLNPVMRIGAQIVEALEVHGRARGQAARDEAIRLLDAGRHQRPGGAVPPVPARVLRRHAPARADRHGPGLPSRGAAGRRADLRARRDRAAARARPDGSAGLRRGRGGAADHPRSRPGGRARRPRRRHVPRRDRRDRPGGRASSPIPQHEYTRRLLAAAPGMAGAKTAARAPGRRRRGRARDPARRSRGAVKKYRIRGRPDAARWPSTASTSWSRRGQTVAIVGESGSGKSTTARLALRLGADRRRHRVSYRGADVSGLRGEELLAFRRAVQPVFQNPYASLDPRYTVAQVVAEPLRVHKIGDAGEQPRGTVSGAARQGCAAVVLRRPLPARAVRRPRLT